MDVSIEVERLRDAIQDVRFFRNRNEHLDLISTISEACEALAQLPDAIVSRIETIDGREWRARLRIAIATNDQTRLAAAENLLWAVRMNIPSLSATSTQEPRAHEIEWSQEDTPSSWARVFGLNLK